MDAVMAALEATDISGSGSKSVQKFEEEFAKFCGVKFAVATTSGTTALELAVAALGIGAGDEVLMSSCTNIASALAIYRNGAVPIPVDSESETWNLNLDLIEKLITPKTKAIMPVHIYGHPVDMDKLMEIAKRHKLLVIEDCAEAHGATVNDRKVGTFGDANCFSFYANKIITTGEGGMVTTDNEAVAEKLRLLRNLAFIEPRFYHKEAGFNFRMTGLQGALGSAQLGKIEKILSDKRKVAELYNKNLSDAYFLQLPAELPWAKNVYWMYGVVIKENSGIQRTAFMEYLKKNGIESRTFFCPMSDQPFLKEQKGYREIPCPVANMLWKQGLYIPSSPNLTEEEIVFISNTIKAFPR